MLQNNIKINASILFGNHYSTTSSRQYQRSRKVRGPGKGDKLEQRIMLQEVHKDPYSCTRTKRAFKLIELDW